MFSLIFVNLKKLLPMNNALLRFLLITLLLVSCKQSTDNGTLNSKFEQTNSQITESDISKLELLEYELDVKTKKAIESWEQYKELINIISKLEKGNSLYFKNNKEVTTSFLKDLKDKIPDTINTPSVSARLMALETKFLKLESLYNLSSTSKDELLQSIKEFLESFSNLNLQMNKKLEKESQIIENPE
jgi:hypothetical protein